MPQFPDSELPIYEKEFERDSNLNRHMEINDLGLPEMSTSEKNKSTELYENFEPKPNIIEIFSNENIKENSNKSHSFTSLGDQGKLNSRKNSEFSLKSSKSDHKSQLSENSLKNLKNLSSSSVNKKTGEIISMEFNREEMDDNLFIAKANEFDFKKKSNRSIVSVKNESNEFLKKSYSIAKEEKNPKEILEAEITPTKVIQSSIIQDKEKLIETIELNKKNSTPSSRSESISNKNKVNKRNSKEISETRVLQKSNSTLKAGIQTETEKKSQRQGENNSNLSRTESSEKIRKIESKTNLMNKSASLKKHNSGNSESKKTSKINSIQHSRKSSVGLQEIKMSMDENKSQIRKKSLNDKIYKTDGQFTRKNSSLSLKSIENYANESVNGKSSSRPASAKYIPEYQKLKSSGSKEIMKEIKSSSAEYSKSIELKSNEQSLKSLHGENHLQENNLSENESKQNHIRSHSSYTVNQNSKSNEEPFKSNSIAQNIIDGSEDVQKDLWTEEAPFQRNNSNSLIINQNLNASQENKVIDSGYSRPSSLNLSDKISIDAINNNPLSDVEIDSEQVRPSESKVEEKKVENTTTKQISNNYEEEPNIALNPKLSETIQTLISSKIDEEKPDISNITQKSMKVKNNLNIYSETQTADNVNKDLPIENKIEDKIHEKLNEESEIKTKKSTTESINALKLISLRRNSQKNSYKSIDSNLLSQPEFESAESMKNSKENYILLETEKERQSSFKINLKNTSSSFSGIYKENSNQSSSKESRNGSVISNKFKSKEKTRYFKLRFYHK
ncbi:hypothetical protein HK096_005246 [Nowakowskiella sp. JEL0078]|nr:hypothetical protein HK096_005246 [Nowakowskiella sp. JEL0078]